MDDLRIDVCDRATYADASAMATLHARCFEEGWSRADIVALAEAPGTLVLTARSVGRLDGFALLRTVLDEAEILTLCVAPDRRRSGLGGELLEAAAAAARARGAVRIHLEVAVDNHAAAALYRKAGFFPAGKRRAYYRTVAGPVDALVLRLDLGGHALRISSR